MQLSIYFNVACQVHICFYKTWKFYFSSPQYKGEMFCQTMHCLNKKVSKALIQKLVERIMKKSNVNESPVNYDNLLIKDAEYGVKRRVLKILLECSMRNFNNKIITSLDDGGLLGDIHADTNDVIFSDSMLGSLAPPKLLPMIDHQKMMCGCSICKNSKYFKNH